MDLTLRVILAAILLGGAAAKPRNPRALVAAVDDDGVARALRGPAAVPLVGAEASAHRAEREHDHQQTRQPDED